MTARLLSTIAALAASVTLGANLISGGSAQAAIFDFNAVWNDSTTTKGWFEVDDTPDYQYSNGGYYAYDYKNWLLNSVLDADFTHEGTRYGKSDLTYLYLYNYNFPEGYYQPYYGNVANHLYLGFNNQTVSFNDNSVDGGAHYYSDSGSKYTNNYGSYGGSATSVSVVERAAKAVPEPTTMAGLALVGIGIAATRRQQTKASVKV